MLTSIADTCLGSLCFFNTCTESTYDLNCKYTEHAVFTVSVRERIIWCDPSLNKSSTHEPSFTMTCDFVLAQASKDSEHFSIPIFTHKHEIWFSGISQQCYALGLSPPVDMIKMLTHHQINYGEIRNWHNAIIFTPY